MGSNFKEFLIEIRETYSEFKLEKELYFVR